MRAGGRRGRRADDARAKLWDAHEPSSVGSIRFQRAVAILVRPAHRTLALLDGS